MSLLLSQGHMHARRYPIVHVWSEARIVRQRNGMRRKIDIALQQQLLGGMFDKAGWKPLNKTLARMDESD